jgi:hypothetical protein
VSADDVDRWGTHIAARDTLRPIGVDRMRDGFLRDQKSS